MSTWTVVLAFVGLAVVMMIGAVVAVEIRLRNKRKPIVKEAKGEVERKYIKMYNDSTGEYTGKGILATTEEFYEYLARWNDADSVLDLGAYLLYSHIPGQRPVYVHK